MHGKRETRTFSSRSPEASSALVVPCCVVWAAAAAAEQEEEKKRARQVPTEQVCPSRRAERLWVWVVGLVLGRREGEERGMSKPFCS